MDGRMDGWVGGWENGLRIDNSNKKTVLRLTSVVVQCKKQEKTFTIHDLHYLMR